MWYRRRSHLDRAFRNAWVVFVFLIAFYLLDAILGVMGW